MILLKILRNRNFILILALFFGIALGEFAKYSKQLTLPALALIMTVSLTQIPSDLLFPFKKLGRPMLIATFLSYSIFSPVMLIMAWWLMPDNDLWIGFVIVASVPPGVAVIPFTYILSGDTTFALIGTVGAYLASMVITPAMAILLIGKKFLSTLKLFSILVQLIVIPFFLSRFLIRFQLARKIEKWRGTIINWGFFIIVFTVVGLNREIFISQPQVLGLTSAVAIVSIFILGYFVDLIFKMAGVKKAARISFILMSTVKNSGLAAATALALFNDRASVPGAVVSAFNILYLVWLGLQAKQRHE